MTTRNHISTGKEHRTQKQSEVVFEINSLFAEGLGRRVTGNRVSFLFIKLQQEPRTPKVVQKYFLINEASCKVQALKPQGDFFLFTTLQAERVTRPLCALCPTDVKKGTVDRGRVGDWKGKCDHQQLEEEEVGGDPGNELTGIEKQRKLTCSTSTITSFDIFVVLSNRFFFICFYLE